MFFNANQVAADTGRAVRFDAPKPYKGFSFWVPMAFVTYRSGDAVEVSVPDGFTFTLTSKTRTVELSAAEFEAAFSNPTIAYVANAADRKRTKSTSPMLEITEPAVLPAVAVEVPDELRN